MNIRDLLMFVFKMRSILIFEQQKTTISFNLNKDS